MFYRIVHSHRQVLYFSRIGLVVLLYPRVEMVVSADSRKMEKKQCRSVIRFLFLESISGSEIKQCLDIVYGVSSCSSSTTTTTFKNWVNGFLCGCMSVLDEPRPGALKTAFMKDNVTKIHDLVLADQPRGTRDSWEKRHFKRAHESYTVWNIEHEKAIDASSAAFAHFGQQAQLWICETT